MEIKYIDVHTHINLDAFSEDWKEVETRTLAEGVAHINVGTGKETSARAVELTKAFEGVYATVGLHPVRAGGGSEVEGGEIFDTEYYEELAGNEHVVAIGECGFDYYRVEKNTKEVQERAFIAQIELANKIGKPLMLHIRDVQGSMEAYEDALRVLKQYAKVLGNVHFFAGTYEIARQFWDMGYTTSFTGVVTFANQYDEIIQKAPIDMLHGETDAPYVAPKPFRGQRNEPLHVREVYKRIAELRGVRKRGALSQEVDSYFAKNSDNLNSSIMENEEYVRLALLQNAQRLFGIKL